MDQYRGQRLGLRDNGGEDSDDSERAVERLRKDVHGLGAAVRTLGEKIGFVSCLLLYPVRVPLDVKLMSEPEPP